MACRIGNEQTSEPGHDEKFCASAYWNTITISACIGSCAAKPWRSVCRLGQQWVADAGGPEHAILHPKAPTKQRQPNARTCCARFTRIVQSICTFKRS